MSERIDDLIERSAAKLPQPHRRSERGARSGYPSVLPRHAWVAALAAPFTHRHPRRATYVSPT